LDCYDGKEVSKSISVKEFHKIDVDFACEVVIEEVTELEIRIEGKEDLIADLEKFSKVENDTWIARVEKKCLGGSRSDAKIFLTVPNLSSIKADGNVKVSTAKALSNLASSFTCDVDGNADLIFDVSKLMKLTIKVDGNADVEMIGSVDEMTVTVDGNSNVKAHEFIAKECTIKVDGSSSADIHVLDLLKVDVDGLSSICYKGNPKIESKVDGVGNIKNCN
jgi:hypothetical protein